MLNNYVSNLIKLYLVIPVRTILMFYGVHSIITISIMLNVLRGYPTTSISGKLPEILSIKNMFYQVNYNFSGIPSHFPATCLKYSNFIGVAHYNFIEHGFKDSTSCRKYL